MTDKRRKRLTGVTPEQYTDLMQNFWRCQRHLDDWCGTAKNDAAEAIFDAAYVWISAQGKRAWRTR